MFPEADSSKMFRNIAEQLVGEEADFTDDGNIKFFWQKIFDR
jgi:hypothetical protein